MLAGRSLYTEIDLTSDFTTLLSGVDECPDEIHVEITLSATKDKLNYHLDRIWWRFGLIVEEEVS
ncbi:MAG: hypothetical protein LBM61_06295, partial [Prevotellaceae bacterium]|jgi:hypothetical protein|nr:hypothetical protein [Prevotellaceae bacterium]